MNEDILHVVEGNPGAMEVMVKLKLNYPEKLESLLTLLQTKTSSATAPLELLSSSTRNTYNIAVNLSEKIKTTRIAGIYQFFLLFGEVHLLDFTRSFNFFFFTRKSQTKTKCPDYGVSNID